jgi:hypothetical protein
MPLQSMDIHYVLEKQIEAGGNKQFGNRTKKARLETGRFSFFQKNTEVQE